MQVFTVPSVMGLDWRPAGGSLCVMAKKKVSGNAPGTTGRGKDELTLEKVREYAKEMQELQSRFVRLEERMMKHHLSSLSMEHFAAYRGGVDGIEKFLDAAKGAFVKAVPPKDRA